MANKLLVFALEQKERNLESTALERLHDHCLTLGLKFSLYKPALLNLRGSGLSPIIEFRNILLEILGGGLKSVWGIVLLDSHGHCVHRTVVMGRDIRKRFMGARDHELIQVHTDQAWRSHGLAKMVNLAILSKLQSDRVFWLARYENLASQNLARSLGFQCLGKCQIGRCFFINYRYDILANQ